MSYDLVLEYKDFTYERAVSKGMKASVAHYDLETDRGTFLNTLIYLNNQKGLTMVIFNAFTDE